MYYDVEVKRFAHAYEIDDSEHLRFQEISYWGSWQYVFLFFFSAMTVFHRGLYEPPRGAIDWTQGVL